MYRTLVAIAVSALTTQAMASLPAASFLAFFIPPEDPVIPEPATVGLVMVGGLAALALARRARRRRQ